MSERLDLPDVTALRRVVAGCFLLSLNEFADSRGVLNVMERGAEGLPFLPERFFVVTGVPAGEVRGGHANRTVQEVLIAVNGSVTVDVDDGVERASVVLDSPRRALHLPAGVWSAQRDFSSGACLVVLASLPYEPADYLDSPHERDRAGDDR